MEKNIDDQTNENVEKYEKYLKEKNKTIFKCNCVCCNYFYRPDINEKKEVVDWKRCQLRKFMQNQLQPLFEELKIERTEGNDVHTDLMYILYDLEKSESLRNCFHVFVREL
jgi:hypothetical protein